MSLDSSTLDPAQLAAFCAQAGPIVAQERGLTPACRRKLAGIARDLGIAEEQIDAAVRALSAAEPAAPPNPQAERFRRRLHKDLAGKSKTIIGPMIEAQIVAKAATKYSLGEALARQVVGEVAAELGLTRITATEAIDGLAAQIDSVAGSRIWLPRETWDRLRTAGDKWGIELTVVEELIDERLAANRQEQARHRRRLHIALAAGGTLALCAGIATFVYLSRPDAESFPAPPSPAFSGAGSLTAAQQPEWWNVELALEVAKAKTEFGGLSGACDLLASAVPAERAAGYERLLSAAVEQPGKAELLNTIGATATACLVLEPDEAAAGRLQAALVGLLPSASAPLDKQPPLSVSLWSLDIATAALSRREIAASRKQSLAIGLSAALDVVADASQPPADLRRTLTGGALLAAYQQLTAAAPHDPASAAARYPAVARAASESLPEGQWLTAEASFLAAALPAAGDQWRTYEAAISRCVSASDPLPALKLLAAYRRVKDPELSRRLAEQLVLKARVQPKSWQPADVAAAVRRALGGAAGAAPASDRWLALREQAAPALARSNIRSTDPRTLLGQTVELAQLTTLAMALAQGESGYAVFDAAIHQPTPAQEPPGEGAGPPPARSTRPTNLTEQREVSRLIEMLSSLTPSRQVPRESALRGLADLAAKTPDVPPRQAEAIAAYLLSPKSPEEFAVSVERAGPLGRWLHLRLAVADGLAKAKLPPEQQRELVAALLGDALPAESAGGAALRLALIQHVHRELGASSAVAARISGSGQDHFADAAAEQLKQTYSTRARLIGVPPVAVQAANSPASALELSIAPLTAGDAQKGELQVRQQAVRFQAADDLHQTVGWQGLLIELASEQTIRQWPDRAAVAKKLETDSLAAAHAAPSVLAQLRDQERTLLELWMLHAPEP